MMRFKETVPFLPHLLDLSIYKSMLSYFDAPTVDKISECLSTFRALHIERFVFRTISDKLGFAHVPLSPGDQILLVPGFVHLLAVSADRRRIVALAELDGMLGDALLTLPEHLRDKWETFTVY
jgi:hypothetical protein